MNGTQGPPGEMVYKMSYSQVFDNEYMHYRVYKVRLVLPEVKGRKANQESKASRELMCV